MSHTPTPWAFNGLHIYAANSFYGIADVTNHNGYPCNAANAAYIVRAVNAHEGLVRALELFLAEFDDASVQMRTPIAYYKAVDAARAVLAAAKE